MSRGRERSCGEDARYKMLIPPETMRQRRVGRVLCKRETLVFVFRVHARDHHVSFSELALWCGCVVVWPSSVIGSWVWKTLLLFFVGVGFFRTGVQVWLSHLFR